MAEKKATEIEQELVDSFRETNKAIAESIIATQQRNMKFAQSMFTSTMEVLKSNAEATRALMQQWEQQAQKQQEAFQKLAQEMGGTQWMESYTNLLRTGFSSYQQVVEATEKATRQGLEDFEKATEAFEKAAQQLPKTPGKQTSS
jgi:hypothetical protein